LTDYHSIRLHGPWQATVLECYQSTAVESNATKLAFPCHWDDWLGAEFRGRVQLVRKFNLPTNLEPDQAVWLIVDSVQQNGSFKLNGHTIGSWNSGDPPFRSNVRHRLLPANELVVIAELPLAPDSETTGTGGFIGSVRLEIESLTG